MQRIVRLEKKHSKAVHAQFNSLIASWCRFNANRVLAHSFRAIHGNCNDVIRTQLRVRVRKEHPCSLPHFSSLLSLHTAYIQMKSSFFAPLLKASKREQNHLISLSLRNVLTGMLEVNAAGATESGSTFLLLHGQDFFQALNLISIDCLLSNRMKPKLFPPPSTLIASKSDVYHLALRKRKSRRKCIAFVLSLLPGC